ncbi:hypothetical protein [Phytohabitans suffuscus]|uniref:Uncharacterized protein n=1 Tax=Phytohabitans suffuscus TaxID=624315 RepID=A0A6F8YWD6_9ACTN|nr:hypothetical protein [Phytohabitans suffuscus]BCB90457.1 hypothetical protein Psuf_077700 [Phytohabitans suffuscus]
MVDDRDSALDHFARWWDGEADDDERATIKAAVAGSYQIPLALATRLSEVGAVVTLPGSPDSADPRLPESYADYAISHPR